MQVKIGKIVNTHGINGEIKVISNSDFKDIRFQTKNVLYVKKKDQWIEITIKNHYSHKTFDIIKVKEFDNINDVIKLKNCYIYGEEIDERHLKEGEFLNSDLEGCVMVNEDGAKKGEVIEVVEYPRDNMLKIKYKKDYLVPFNPKFIINVDITKKEIIFHEMKGLIDED